MPLEIDDLPDDRPADQQVDASVAAATPPVSDATANQTPANPAPNVPVNPPAAAPAAAATPPAAAPDGAAPNQATAQATAAAQAQGFPNARAYAAHLGYQNANSFADDQAFLQSLIAGQQTYQQQLAEAKQMAQYGQLWLAEQSKRQQQPAPGSAPADPLAVYKAPEFDPRWEAQVTRDPATGELKLVPGADPTILPKIHAYQEHRRNITDKFLSDPVAFLQPLISNLVGKQGQQLIETRLGAMQEQQYTDSFISTNRGWLFQADSAGRQVTNPATGQPLFTPAGAAFVKHLKFGAEQLGIQGSARQEHYARTALAAEMQMPGAANQAAIANDAAAKAALLAAQNRNNPNRSGSLVGPDATGHTAPAAQNPHLSLKEQLAAAFQQEGMTDAMIAADPR
jgi:hypothetical protein